MEKQRSFSVKPIRNMVFSFTISFSAIFFFFWVYKSSSTSSFTQNLGVTSNSLLRNAALTGRNSWRDGDSSRIAPDVSRESEIASGTDAGSKRGGSLTGNSSFNPSGKNVVVENFTVLNGAESTVNGSEELSGDSEESEVSVGSDAGSKKYGSLIGNSSFTPSGKNDVVENFTVLNGSESTVNDSEELSGESNGSDEEVGDSLLTGNSNFTLYGKSLVVDNFTVSNSTKFSGSGEGFKDVIDTTSDVTQHSSIRQEKEVDCDITKGKWVFDESYPLYTNVTCPFIDEGFSCEANGRLDKDYMRWRWQPHDCDLPRFNATKMLELMRGKRLVFVGDSINRNQWESMLCLLMGGVKDPKKVYEARGRKITKERNNYCFKFEDYKCTLEFYVSHFLVHESKARIGKKKGQTLRIDTIDRGSSRWRGADILVFNTAHWWNHHKTKAGINYYQERDQVYPRLDVNKAFQRALLTWSSWVDKNINPHKTRVFFRSSSPSHFSGGQWNAGGHCKEAFRPINETFTPIYPERNLIVEETLRQMKNPVTFLNITRLSDYRPDAHPSIYGRKMVNPGVQDCSHWCLPGVPDNWNELLYYYLQLSTKKTSVG